MTGRRIVVFGGSGSGAFVAQSIEALAMAAQSVSLLGYLNDTVPKGERISGVPVIGAFVDWPTLPEDVGFIAPLHKFGLMQQRLALIESLGIPDARWTSVIDPRSAVARDAVIGRGTFVGPFATIGPGAVIGPHAAIRPGAMVSHDCALGDFVFVGTNAVVSGRCNAGRGAYIAPNATIVDGSTIGAFAMVGLGSVVTKDVSGGIMVAGAPARAVRPVPKS